MRHNKLLFLPIVLLSSCSYIEPSQNISDDPTKDSLPIENSNNDVASVESTMEPTVEPSLETPLDEILFNDKLINKGMDGYEVYNLISKDDKKSFFNINQFNFEMNFVSNDKTIDLSSQGFGATDNLPTNLGIKKIDYLNVKTINNLKNSSDISRYVRFDNSTILNEKIGNYSTLYSMGEIYFFNEEIKAMSGQVISETGENHTYISDNIPMFLPNDQSANDFYLPSRVYSSILKDLYSNCFSEEYKEYQSYDFTLYNDYIELNISNQYGTKQLGIDFDILLKQDNYFKCSIRISTSTKQVENISFELKSRQIAHSMYQGILNASLTRTNYSNIEINEMVNKELEFLKNSI